MSKWMGRDAPWPDWKDDGAMVEVKLPDRAFPVIGKLFVSDMTPGPDECPVFRIRLPDGSDASFVDHDKWRFWP
jgi:hypothetical protein